MNRNSQLIICKSHSGDAHRRRKWKCPIMSSRLATLMRFWSRYLRWAAMLCYASRTLKIAAKCPISSHCVPIFKILRLYVVGFKKYPNFYIALLLSTSPVFTSLAQAVTSHKRKENLYRGYLL